MERKCKPVLAPRTAQAQAVERNTTSAGNSSKAAAKKSLKYGKRPPISSHMRNASITRK